MRNEYDICKSMVTGIRIEMIYIEQREGHRVTHVEHRKEESQFLSVTRVTGVDGIGFRKGTRGRDEG